MKAWAVATVAVAASATMSACSGSTGGPANKKGAIVWWVPSPTPQKNTLKDAAARFTKATGIKVEVDEYPWSVYLNKLTSALASGTGPDVADIGNTWAASLASGLHPFSAKELSQIGGTDQFLPNVLKASERPGKPITAVPFNAQSWVLLYNKEQFKQAGITSPPKTWTELVADGKKLTDATQGRYGVATSAAGSPTAGTLAWVVALQNGASLLSKGYKTATLNTPAAVQAITDWINQLVVTGIMNPEMTTDTTGSVADNRFDQGKAAMDITQNVEPALKDPERVGIALIPLRDAGARGTRAVMSHVAGEDLVIYKNTQHLSEDIQFIKYMVSTAEQVRVNKELYELPVTMAASRNGYFQSANQKAFTEILSQHAAPYPATNNAQEILTNFDDAVVNLFREAASTHHLSRDQVASALKAAEAKANAAGD